MKVYFDLPKDLVTYIDQYVAGLTPAQTRYWFLKRSAVSMINALKKREIDHSPAPADSVA